MSSRIFVTFQKEGIHCYPAALNTAELSDVNFLGHPHRHIFHFRVEVSVIHDDRDIEFIQFKRWLESLYSNSILELNYKSCEMMTKELKDKILEKYINLTYIKIEISEDGENGAILELDYRELHDEYSLRH